MGHVTSCNGSSIGIWLGNFLVSNDCKLYVLEPVNVKIWAVRDRSWELKTRKNGLIVRHPSKRDRRSEAYVHVYGFLKSGPSRLSLLYRHCRSCRPIVSDLTYACSVERSGTMMKKGAKTYGKFCQSEEAFGTCTFLYSFDFVLSESV